MALKLAIVRVHDAGEVEPEILFTEDLAELLEAQFSFRAKPRAGKLAAAVEAAVKAKTVALP